MPGVKCQVVEKLVKRIQVGTGFYTNIISSYVEVCEEEAANKARYISEITPQLHPQVSQYDTPSNHTHELFTLHLRNKQDIVLDFMYTTKFT